ncbi:MAG TPA: A/G-specific adenine glycosylase [Verrucomicrobiae bacterium]|nr:A/G-specific adenine glycosylase [Verrucomicrobiae bacterium]
MATRFHSHSARVNAKTVRAFHRDLVRWYQRHHRKLPWRATHDPYKIWVSEIMLQQTRVEVVRDYYQRWIHAFPTVESLANAPDQRVLKLWEGLGYYSRARNLHRAARLLAVGRDGPLGHPKQRRARRSRPATAHLPQDTEGLMRLPGIGRYTAGAIASIAFGQRVPVVDGNVARVLARVFGVRADVTKPATRKLLWDLATEILPLENPGTFNQAVMELGALVCTPANPRCDVCPLSRICLARTNGQQDELPNRGGCRTPERVTQDAAFVRRGRRVLLRRRPAHGLLAGMWELPPLEKTRFRPRRPLVTLRHAITNKRITLRVFACEPAAEPKCNGHLRWASPKDLARLALPAAHRRAVEEILATEP